MNIIYVFINKQFDLLMKPEFTFTVFEVFSPYKYIVQRVFQLQIQILDFSKN